MNNTIGSGTRPFSIIAFLLIACVMSPHSTRGIDVVVPPDTRYNQIPVQPRPETDYGKTIDRAAVPFREIGIIFSTDGKSIERLFSEPVSLTLDIAGRLYVLDQVSGRVLIFNPQTGQLLRAWGKKGRGETQMLRPSDIAVSNAGEVLISDVGDRTIKIFNTFGAFQKKIIMGGSTAPITVMPVSLDIDASGRIYVGDEIMGVIHVVNLDGEILDTLQAVENNKVFEMSPRSIEITRDLLLYTADATNDQIRRFLKTGKLIRSIPGKNAVPGAGLKYPHDAKLDRQGRILVADTGNYRIAFFDRDSKYIGELKWKDSAGQPLVEPVKIALDVYGNLYIVDRRYNRVIRVDASLLP